MVKIFCGIDWGERHPQVALVDDEGRVLANRRISDDVAGFGELTGMLAEHDAEAPVPVALETGRGLLVAALVSAGHLVFSINPKAVNRYRDLVACAHQDAVWMRHRDVGRLRSILREFFPAALEAFTNLATNAAMAILAAAPTPTVAAALNGADIAGLLATTGRGVRPSEVTRLRRTFTAVALRQPAPVERSMGLVVQALVRTIAEASAAIRDLEAALAEQLADHPDAEILQSVPGLGVVSGGRILGEFGDDHARFADIAGRRCFAGHRADHPRLRKVPAGPAPSGPQPTTVRCLPLVGVRCHPPVRRRSRLLPAPTRHWRHTRDRAQTPCQQADRSASPLPGPPRALPRRPARSSATRTGCRVRAKSATCRG